MKKLLILFSLIVAFISCDGRERAYLSNEAILKEDHLFEAFNEGLRFIPEAPLEIVTDTILNTGFQVKINYHSVDHKPVIYSKKNKYDSITYSHYRNFEAQIQISKDHQTIINSALKKSDFRSFESSDFWDKAIMQFVWINHETSTEKNIQLHTAFHIPETEIYRDFILNISKGGNITIKENYLTQKTI